MRWLEQISVEPESKRGEPEQICEEPEFFLAEMKYKPVEPSFS
jgi:hypothetical protein